APDADASHGGSLEGASGIGKLEIGFHASGRIVGAETEAVVERLGVNDLARVHDAVGGPDALELAEGFGDLLAIYAREQFALGEGVAVLCAQRAAVFHHEIGRLLNEAAESLDTGGSHQIEVDAAVDASLAEVAIEGGVVAVFFEQRAE